MNRRRMIVGALLVVAAALQLMVYVGVLAESQRDVAGAEPRLVGAPRVAVDEPREAPAEQAAPASVDELELEEAPEPAPALEPDDDPSAEPEEPVERSPWEVAYEGNNLMLTHDGRPVEGVEVRLYDPRLVGGRPLEVATSDAKGLVVFERDELGVRVFDGPPRRFLEPGEAGAFDLGDESEFPVEGRVVGPDGEPIADASVSLQFGAYGVSAARSDGAGGFTVLSNGGSATLVVAADGYLPARLSLDVLRKQRNVVQLLRGDRGALGGVVVDGRGQPLADVLVRATSGTGGFLLAETDTFGRFGFDHLPAGSIVLQVHRGEVVPVAQRTAVVRARDVTEVTIQVTQRGVLALRVHDRGEPVADADVRLSDSGVTRYGNFEANATNQSGRTDAEGWVAFELPAGGYYARVRARGGDHTIGGSVVDGQRTELSLDVSELRSLRVRVVDPQGNPVPGVFMDVSLPGINWSGMPSSRTDAEGVGRFEQLPHGLAEVHLGKGGLWRMVRSAEEEVEFVWTDATQLRLQGRVAGAGGELLAVSVLPDVARMHRLELPGGDLDATLDVPDGPQTVVLLPPDRRLAPVSLGVVPGTGELTGFEVEFPEAGRVRGSLRCGGRPAAGRIVLGGAWGAVQEARVQWESGTDHDPWITVNEWAQASGPDGAFSLDGLAPGAHTLELSALGCRPRSVAFEVGPGGDVDLGELELEPAE